uniref:Uncharacterized protein n=1 Tax=Nelumbo nucifera TaxID=4432 RepID=A0A822XNZ1_NELNU|nr:TPA_asm: hypothetical protein HUJ06_022242 [Nelumbo nucifera]
MCMEVVKEYLVLRLHRMQSLECIDGDLVYREGYPSCVAHFSARRK